MKTSYGDIKYIIYDQHEAPHEVYVLAAFCKEHDLNLQAMWRVVTGRSKQHMGWHMDVERTDDLITKAEEIGKVLDKAWADGGRVTIRLNPEVLKQYGFGNDFIP